MGAESYHSERIKQCDFVNFFCLYVSAAGLAAAIAQHQQPSGFLPGGPPGHLPPGHPGHHGAHGPPRDTYPLYPWLLSRHGRIFPHRFPGGEFFRFD